MVHSSLICSTQTPETTKMPIKGKSTIVTFIQSNIVHPATATDRKDIGLNVNSRTQESTYCIIPLYEVLEQGKLIYGYRNQNSGELWQGVRGVGRWP